jgi:hypothetical protein
LLLDATMLTTMVESIPLAQSTILADFIVRIESTAPIDSTIELINVG